MSDPAIAWANPPVDDVGYLPATTLLALTDEELVELVVGFERTRYEGWRNWNGNWRRVLKLDDTQDSDVMEYGCGVGIEALQYARAGNRVLVSDIALENVELAIRVLRLMGFPAQPVLPPYDVIHCAGCLHHIPDAVGTMERFHEMLRRGGEVRLMLYSDWAWIKHVGDDPPEDTPSHPAFTQYVAAMDGVGEYADWYDEDKLERWFGKWFRIENFEYLTQDLTYCGAILVKQ